MHREQLLKNGKTLVVRRAQPEDAEETIRHIQIVAGETENLTFGPGEHKTTVEKQMQYIEWCLTSPNCVFFVATIDGEIVGMINFGGGNRPRNRHVGEFGITVQQRAWGLGVGRELLQALIDWARETGVVRKINLRVRTDNVAGVKLYEKLGFVQEAKVSRDMIVNGEFVDIYLMGLEID